MVDSYKEDPRETVLGSAANERELFLTNECVSVQLERAKEQKKEKRKICQQSTTAKACTLLIEGDGFFSRGSGFCTSCRITEDKEESSTIKLNVSKTGFCSNGIEYFYRGLCICMP